MKKIFFNVLAVALSVVTLSSCEDMFSENTGPDGSVPYIQVHSPRNNSTINADSPLRVSTIVTDKDKVADFSVTVMNSSNEEVYKLHQNPNNNVVNIDSVLINNGLPAGNYSMAIRAVDGRTNEKIAKIDFKVNQ